MIDPGKAVKESSVAEPPPIAPPKKVISALIFGLAFGFLLQKGGVGKYHILLGQLLLQDWTVVKIMMTAVVVGMVGIFALHHFAKVNLHIKPTKLGPNIIGGLVFGAGFALIGYCPGTGAAALGWLSYRRGLPSAARPELLVARGAGGFGIDRLYHAALTRPFAALAQQLELMVESANERGVDGIAGLAVRAGSLIRRLQAGPVRGYEALVLTGTVILLAFWSLR